MRPRPRHHPHELVATAPGEQPPATGHLVRQALAVGGEGNESGDEDERKPPADAADQVDDVVAHRALLRARLDLLAAQD